MEGMAQGNQEPRVRSARSRGYTISYEDAGDGAPLVLITGLTGSAQQMREDGYVGRLAAARRVLNVDPLGHGRSEKPYGWEAYRSPDVAADVIAVLDAAGIERAALWGYSRGARLACIAAVEYPDRVTALILGGSGDLTAAPPPGLPPWLDALAQGEWSALWSALPFTIPSHKKRQFERSDPMAISAVIAGDLQSTYVLDLGRVAVPTLVYCGGRDDPDAHRRTADALGVELRVVGDAGHPETLDDVEGVLPLAVAHLVAAGI